ncbi:MAG: YdiU family protein [Rhodocyclaceae bacterium]|nr:YdiU family protein [Rhodocyclaceae bacterium]
MNAPERARARLAPAFDNGFARLPERFYTRLEPWGVPDPHLVAVSPDATALLGLAPDVLACPEAVAWLAGNRRLPGSDPLAAVYSGHQFGVWAGQLGDGRAHLLGEVAGPQGNWEVQLKGAGRTPYSRMGDGRAVLRSSIREFLCSEAMAALDIPTTRALALVGSPLVVHRETPETAAVVTRLAPSFVRFGSFEHWAAARDIEALRLLVDHVTERHFPEAFDSANRAEALLAAVSRSTGHLVAQWQAVGFMHGVMNTDNMSILGLTIDYGPFGFMEAFNGAHVCNHSDSAGRYRFSRQPQVAHWNLLALATALLPLLGDDAERARAAVDGPYADAYNARFAAAMRAKLGFAAPHPDDESLIGGLYGLLQRNRCDYPMFFRQLGRLPSRPDAATRAQLDAPVRDLFPDRDDCDAWLASWRQRLMLEGRADGERQQSMNRANPSYVLRNWVAETAIRAAQGGDFGVVAEVLDCLRRPFDEQPRHARFAAPPPDWADGLEVSCSS